MAYSGHWDEGMKLIEKVYRRNEPGPGVQFLIVFVDRYKREKFEEAVKIVHKMALPQLWITYLLLAAAHGQLENTKEADSALAQLRILRPTFQNDARGDLKRCFHLDEVVEGVLDGLRKAGLKIPEQSVPAK